MPWLTRFDRRKSAILGTAPERNQLATLPGGQYQITHVRIVALSLLCILKPTTWLYCPGSSIAQQRNAIFHRISNLGSSVRKPGREENRTCHLDHIQGDKNLGQRATLKVPGWHSSGKQASEDLTIRLDRNSRQ